MKIKDVKVKGRRGQIKSFETIAVLLVFFFLLVFGVIFYAQIQKSSFQRQLNQNNQISTINIALKTSNLPEVDCVLTGVKTQNCFDIIKARALGNKLEDPNLDLETRLAYFSIFAYSTISLDVLDDAGQSREKILIYNNTNSGGFNNVRMPVKVYEPISKRFHFGVVEVAVYEESAV